MPIGKLHQGQDLNTYIPDSLGSWTIEKIDVSSVNNLAIKVNPSGRSLIYIKNNRGPVELQP